MARSAPYPASAIAKPLLEASSKRSALSLLSALLLMVSAASSWAQSRDLPKTFASTDGVFSFRYSRQLIQCQQKKQASGDGYYWIPAENCAAYHPVCDGKTGEDNTAITCIAYPRNRFTNTSAFEAATFSVEIVNQIATAQGCLAGPADQMFSARPAVRIHGVSFAVFEFGEGGMNQSVSGEVYRTFHRGRCYQLGINVAMANPGVFDPPARELTKGDRREVKSQLEQARDSFRFIK